MNTQQTIYFDIPETSFRKLIKNFWFLSDYIVQQELKKPLEIEFHKDYLLEKRPTLDKSFRESMQEAGYVFSSR